MASARRETVGSALRAAHARTYCWCVSIPITDRIALYTVIYECTTPPHCGDFVAKPTSTIEAPTAFDFFNDPDVLLPQVHWFQEYTLDNDTADADFAAFTAGLLAHVMFPISYAESAKLLDLEHEHDFYHSTVNEILFCLLHHPLHGNALSVYHECARTHPADGRYALRRLRYEVDVYCQMGTRVTVGKPTNLAIDIEGVPDANGMRYWTQMRAITLSETVDPAPQLATIRRLCERHRKIKPTYSDSDRVADLWHILSESAKKSPYVAPLYLVVLRELRSDAHPDTRGACPFVCLEAFANNKHLITSKPAPPRPAARPATCRHRACPADCARAADAAFQSVRLSPPAPGDDSTIDTVDGDTLVVSAAEDLAPPLPDEPAGTALAFHDEDTD
ncbi:hypothetical protein CYMTET_56643 [Cymbomonas tetramitiformis]|uniref:Uncharacterized protein n=1 Tax=Cymbomonas tetramitiformis TaxID=36881 RepID=A0AAE0BAV8_9CHLO|nr:hypothetical protein CYMTET_56643 [Cymbomonas tetramitiformis]